MTCSDWYYRPATVPLGMTAIGSMAGTGRPVMKWGEARCKVSAVAEAPASHDAAVGLEGVVIARGCAHAAPRAWGVGAQQLRVRLQGTLSCPTMEVLSRLVSLFGMSTLLKDLGDFVEDGYLTGPMAGVLREEYYQVCHAACVHAIDNHSGYGRHC